MTAELRQVLDAIIKLSSRIDHLSGRIDDLENTIRPGKKQEIYYQKLLEKKFNGKHLEIPGYGTSDVTTDEMHIEIKKWSNYSEAIGQLKRYNKGAPRNRLCIYLYGENPKDDQIARIVDLCMDEGFEMYSFAEDDSIQVHIPQGGGSFLRSFADSFIIKNEKGFIENQVLIEVIKKLWKLKHVDTPFPFRDTEITSFFEKSVFMVRKTCHRIPISFNAHKDRINGWRNWSFRQGFLVL